MGQLDLLHDTVLAEDYPAEAPLAVRAAEKSATALKSISEVAGEIGVEPHVLRFWEEKFALLQPVKLRGGRRYYRPEDVMLIHHIRDLLHHQGYTIKGAQALLSQGARPRKPAREQALPSVVAHQIQHAGEQISRTQLQSVLAELKQMRSILLTLVQGATP